jgi:hypothetical protein
MSAARRRIAGLEPGRRKGPGSRRWTPAIASAALSIASWAVLHKSRPIVSSVKASRPMVMSVRACRTHGNKMAINRKGQDD